MPDIASKKPIKKSKNLNFELARFIVNKYVLPNSINWPRDIKIANKLIIKYPEMGFWNWLPVKFQLANLCGLLTPKAKNHLSYNYINYNKEMERNKLIVIKQVPVIKIHDTNYNQYEAPEIVKPKTRLDFLK